MNDSNPIRERCCDDSVFRLPSASIGNSPREKSVAFSDGLKLSIIVPVYNEVNTLLEIVKQIEKQDYQKEIIIVDDGSNDGTTDLLRSIDKRNIKIVFHDKNRGKGYVIRSALEYITGDIVIIQDADLEYHPDDYRILIDKIIENKADVVYGIRFLGAHRVFKFHHYIGNRLLNLLVNIVLNANFTDVMTGYKALKADKLKELNLHCNGFGIELEMTVEVFRRGFSIYEMPISYSRRDYNEGKKIIWVDFFRCLYWLLRSSVRKIDTRADNEKKM